MTIKEAIKICKELIGECDDETYIALQTLIDIAERYEKVAGVMPKKISGKHDKCWEIDRDYCLECDEEVDIHPERVGGYNQAIDHCTFAITKKLEGLEDVTLKELRNKPIAGNFDRTQAIFVNDVVLERLAKAIMDMITEET